MSDKATFVFKQGDTYSSGVHIHIFGSNAVELLREGAPHLRMGNAAYSCARFAGFLHTKISGRLGLGIDPPPKPEDIANDFWDFNPGDKGVFVVDVETGEVTNFCLYEEPVAPFKLTITTAGENPERST